MQHHDTAVLALFVLGTVLVVLTGIMGLKSRKVRVSLYTVGVVHMLPMVVTQWLIVLAG